MAIKLALTVLISLGLLVVGVAAVQVARSESSAAAALEGHATASSPCASRGVSAASSELSQSGHVGWNVASWLIGLGLVAAVGRPGDALRSRS